MRISRDPNTAEEAHHGIQGGVILRRHPPVLVDRYCRRDQIQRGYNAIERSSRVCDIVTSASFATVNLWRKGQARVLDRRYFYKKRYEFTDMALRDVTIAAMHKKFLYTIFTMPDGSLKQR
ncbi:hypothetical protein [Sphingomonas sp. PP-CE-1G-424]|uniref:hypothetical protein n=1 Tax=Sphingomonas sp. PP-CE-1G-424 TaxID=2135658 RepID=UPI001055A1A1|nr:hypothetical protein [Sphingomonas sp. PP-CE-1G-424]